MKKPSFFLSSTIYDFKDLRSAIKYFLEEQGCTVFASEFNDFPKPLESNTYLACLETLKRSDYFILLIGNRVGGWFDEPNKISITQKEYREAYNLHLQGKLKIVAFIRSDMWNLQFNRKELAKYIESLSIDPSIKNNIIHHPSKTTNDPEFIFNFINEVRRASENNQAVKNGTPRPTGNWVHVFDTFRDVIDVIKTEVYTDLPIDQLVLRNLLHQELIELLRNSLVKFDKDHIYSPYLSVILFHQEHKLTINERNKQSIRISSKRWDNISTFALHLLVVKFDTLILQRVLESPAFLKFDLNCGAFKTEPVYNALYQLNEEIKKINSEYKEQILNVIFEHTPNLRPPNQDFVQIESKKLLSFLYLMDRWVNVILLTMAIINYLRDKPFVMPILRPPSPIPDINEQLAQETVTLDDVEKFINEEEEIIWILKKGSRPKDKTV